MIIAVPCDIPVSTPVVDVEVAIVATPVLLLVHAPPADEVSKLELPWQIVVVPVIAEGGGLKTTVAVALPVQPLTAVAIAVYT